MNTRTSRTLFVAWQDQSPDRRWFPIGRLDADVGKPEYKFRYVEGAKQAISEAEFSPLLEFPDLDQSYRSGELFPIFQNRVMWPGRPDFPRYLRELALTDGAYPIEILAANGGRKVTDSFEVFPKPVRGRDGKFNCRFFLHSTRYMNRVAQERIGQLQVDEVLRIATELNNPLNEPAVQVQTEDHHVIGYAPRYLAEDLAATKASTDVEARVVQVNPVPSPWEHRVLVEMVGYWNEHEPMSGPDYQPLVD